ncbi:Dps family protein [Kaistella jeonii]|nr:DNA starvation/stationary phase protection protein [Kaistella jeonii]SFB69752.1 starvation-inducible DNA-binding protein [Kaistella jeonii]VEI94766.1 Metalloregulation DNA-binding stress protein [Kaistella jeonii]
MAKQDKTTSPTSKKSSNKMESKGFPAQPQLSVPTDLKPTEVQNVVHAVNPLIADAFALYTKTKNFHWHLSGSHFRDYHLLFDEQAEAIYDSIDILAERVRRIGGTTIRSISHISQLQTISDNNDDFVSAQDMIAALLADNRHIAANQRTAIKTTEDNRDSPTSNLLQEQLDATERRIWFLFEISQGFEN